ncbi:MAG: hypothetical protein JSW43_06735 [Gemmatimonadota bacterium]|nr:MAG: hypothetical protein JSW43_06735 [Gemmatimonadota bacterium]
MRRVVTASPIALLAVLMSTVPLVAQSIPTPESVLGFVPGTDRKLVEWPVLVEYYQQLAAASDRVEYRELGKTTLGAPFVALVVSSAENMARLDEIRAANQKLADPRLLASDAEREQLIREGRAIVLITSSIHSTEVGGHFAPAIIAHTLASDNSPAVRRILDETVLLLVPSLNPDGVSIVARWYNETLGTKAEGAGPPELYHHYVGHDNNRDWYAFTQVETQLTVDSLHNVWHPQIVHDIHQTSARGARYFVPPYIDPFEPNVDPLIVQGYSALGTSIAWELLGQGKTGVIVSARYDAWTPARAYQHYHAGVRILSETASAELATPLRLGIEDLAGRVRGSDPTTPTWNFPAPWPGGRWGLGDIVDYMTAGAFALLRNAAVNRELWLGNFVRIGERAVRGWEGWPYAYVIPRDGQDAARLSTMLGILQRGQVEIRTARSAVAADGEQYPAGSYVVVLRQPYAAFAKAMLEEQVYPDLRLYDGGPPQPPYDVTAHTLPLLMQVQVALLKDSVDVSLSEPVAIPLPRYDYPGVTASQEHARVALYKSYAASMDEGWTRWIFDTWGVPYTSLVDSVVQAGNLQERFDVIILPDMRDSTIIKGLPTSRYPAPYAGGIGVAGIVALNQFVEAGGTLLAFNDASIFAIGALDLPVKNALAGKSNEEFFAPGSLFRLDLDTDHPLARGMPGQVAAWFERSPAFEVERTRRARVIGRWAADPDRVLMSGWVLRPEEVAGRAAMVEVSVGQGRVILYGFRPQYRAQTLATYPLVFNAFTGSAQ